MTADEYPEDDWELNGKEPDQHPQVSLADQIGIKYQKKHSYLKQEDYKEN
jgi:hypothetical protein